MRLVPFGWSSIDKGVLQRMVECVPNGILLELGSGGGTLELSKYYKIYSVEHDYNWLNRYPTNYIYAPIINGWYDVSILKQEISFEYDILLVDGPPGFIGRGGFCEHLDLFCHNIPIFIDDVHRLDDLNLLMCVANKLNRKYYIFTTSHKKCGVIYFK